MANSDRDGNGYSHSTAITDLIANTVIDSHIGTHIDIHIDTGANGDSHTYTNGDTPPAAHLYTDTGANGDRDASADTQPNGHPDAIHV
jgi:hypothetical protein